MKNLIIVKVGTNVLTETTNENQQLDLASFKRIGAQIRELSTTNHIVLVSSAAITAGVAADGRRRETIADAAEFQRYAARGWNLVVRQWQITIGTNRISSALLTKRDLQAVRTRRKIFDFIACCFTHNDVVLINENDTICDDEIKFGDNDALAATLAAECANTEYFNQIQLVLLTNRNGLNRIATDDSTLIRQVADIATVEPFARQPENCHSRGGMITKLQAARIAGQAGITTHIANGRTEQAIIKVLTGKIGTTFNL